MPEEKESVELTTELKNHEHPITTNFDAGAFIYGRKLRPGDIIEINDVYDSTNGTWGKAPVSGMPLGEGVTVIWIRPESQ